MDSEQIKEIFGEYWDDIKDKSWWNLSNKEFENIAYKQVAEELKQGDYKPHIQLKAVEKAKGNKDVIESLYIQFRVSELTDEFIAIARDHEAKVNAKRRELEAELKAKRKAENKAKKEARRNSITPDYENYKRVKMQTYIFGLVIILILILVIIKSL